MFDHSSSVAVAATLWVLLAFSVATWALIVAKGVQFFRASRANRQYQAAFRAALNLQTVAEIPDNRVHSRASPAWVWACCGMRPPGQRSA